MWRTLFLVGSLNSCVFASTDFAAQPMMKKDVDGITFGKYLEMQCAGQAYTVDSNVKGSTVVDSTLTKVCNGWGDITEKQCIQKCIEHAHPAHCHSGHQCHAAVFYPKDPKSSSMSSKGWCHLYEKSQCKKFRFSVGLPTTFVKEQTSPDRRLGSSTCKKDSACHNDEICIGWSYLNSKYEGKCGKKASAANGGICSRDKECSAGHCVTGYCLTQGRACKDGKNEFGCDYQINVEKTAGENKLGIQIIFPGLLITQVESSGLIPDWNKAHPSKEVKTGDRIIKVNGKMFWDDASIDALKKDNKLAITIMGGHVSKAAIKAAQKAEKSGKDYEEQQKWEMEPTNERVDEHFFSPSSMACILVGLVTLVGSVAVLAINRRRSNTAAQPFDEQKFVHAEEDPAIE